VRNTVTRLAGPTLLVGSVVAVWIGVGLGTLSTPQTTQAATTRTVPAVAPFRPSAGVVVAVIRAGDRVQLKLTGSSGALLDLAPGVATSATSLPELAAAATAGQRPRVRLDYGRDGSITHITAIA